jgi:hypothetical protein
MQQPLLSNGSANKDVSTAKIEYKNNGKRRFYAAHAKIL